MFTCIFTEVIADLKCLVVVTDVFKIDEAYLLYTVMQHKQRCNSYEQLNA